MKKRTCPTPTTQQLAEIAAHFVHLCNGDAPKAARLAIQLWEACASEIYEEAKAAKNEAELRKVDFLNHPAFTANSVVEWLRRHSSHNSGASIPFGKVLQRLMPKVRKPDDRMARLRLFLQEVDGVDIVKAGEEIAGLKELHWSGFLFALLQVHFKDWWERHVSEARSKAGKGKKNDQPAP